MAGTHGKTTTSSMVAHLLHHAGVDAGAFLGGISVNLGSNLLLPATPDAPIVVEADEYDRSFLTLFPDVAIVTSTDADHLDIYGDQSALIDSFCQFVAQIKPGGTLLLNHTADARVAAAVPPGTRVIRYGLSPEQGPELYAAHITAEGPPLPFRPAPPRKHRAGPGAGRARATTTWKICWPLPPWPSSRA